MVVVVEPAAATSVHEDDEGLWLRLLVKTTDDGTLRPAWWGPHPSTEETRDRLHSYIFTPPRWLDVPVSYEMTADGGARPIIVGEPQVQEEDAAE